MLYFSRCSTALALDVPAEGGHLLDHRHLAQGRLLGYVGVSLGLGRKGARQVAMVRGFPPGVSVDAAAVDLAGEHHADVVLIAAGAEVGRLVERGR